MRNNGGWLNAPVFLRFKSFFIFYKLTKVNSFVRLTEILKSDIIDAKK